MRSELHIYAQKISIKQVSRAYLADRKMYSVLQHIPIPASTVQLHKYQTRQADSLTTGTKDYTLK